MANTQGTMTNDRAGSAGNRGGNAGVMDKAQDAVTGAVDTAKEWAAGAADKARDWASNVSDTAQDWASGVASGTGQAYEATRDAVSSAEQSLEAFVRRHPIQTLMFAFGAGCLVGMAFCRRD